MSPELKTSEVNSYRIHQWHNSDSHLTLLALHGFTGSGLDFECFGQDSTAHCQWIAPDLPGHGSTQTNIPSITNFNSTLTSLHNLILATSTLNSPKNKPILLGYSLGARLALGLAISYPNLFSKLILIGVNPGLDDPTERSQRQQSDESLANSILTDGVDTFYHTWESNPLIATQQRIHSSIRTPMRERRLQLNTPQGLAFSLKTTGLAAMPSYWNQLPSLQIPTLLVTGTDDSKFTTIAQSMLTHLPHATHITLPNAGHAALWENKTAFIAALNQFLG